MGAAAVIWGLMSPVSKLVMQQGEVSSASLATFRLLGAAILFWLASAFVPGEPIERKHRLPLFTPPCSESFSIRWLSRWA